MSSDEEELKRQMAENPDDHFSRGLLADHLREQEDPTGRKHTAGERIHWWLGALQHIAKGGPSPFPPVGAPAQGVERHLPGWVARLNQVRGVREALRGHSAESDPRVRAALHAAELHGYGLLLPEESDAARRGRLGITSDNRPWNRRVRAAVYGTLASNAHRAEHYPPADAQGTRANRVEEERALRAHSLSTHRLSEYARMNPPPEDTPERLSRPAETVRRLDRKRQWMSRKIREIMDEGVRGKPVDQKQAVAIAYSTWKEKHGQ